MKKGSVIIDMKEREKEVENSVVRAAGTPDSLTRDGFDPHAIELGDEAEYDLEAVDPG